ncbi:hypothetical protein RI129_009818 [Pyrocoelia pectoralis]|uniref:Ubiquitin-like domain-containing protein n=1 Tax=Pyrocoelia pectoralis TaxID=417401 RepID=A0AAN7ZIN8_9COLE
MKIFIKVLQGDGCIIEVTENMKILDVKKQIENHLKVPLSQQTLVLLGRTLADDQTIGSYPKIKDGTKVHLVIKKPESLEEVLGRFLHKYYSEKHTKLIVEEFMKDFHNKVKTLSLDDLERLAISYLNDENM